MSRIVTCVSDTVYLKYTKPFLESIYNTNPELKVHLRLVDVNETYSFNSNVNVVYDTPSACTKRRYLRYPDYRLADYKYVNKKEPDAYYSRPGPETILERYRLLSDLSIYCIYAKYLNVKQLLKEYDEVLLLDVDALVKGDLSPIFEFLTDVDVCIKQEQYHNCEYTIFNEGVLGIKSNDRTKQFVDNIIKHYDNVGLKEKIFQADQLMFREEYYEHSVGIDFFNLPNKYKDETFQDDSIIWSGCGDNKKILSRFI